MRRNKSKKKKKKKKKKIKQRWINVYKLQMKEAVFFNNVQKCIMTDPFTLATQAFKLINKDFKHAILEGPTYIYDICWKLEF